MSHKPNGQCIYNVHHVMYEIKKAIVNAQRLILLYFKQINAAYFYHSRWEVHATFDKRTSFYIQMKDLEFDYKLYCEKVEEISRYFFK